MRFTTDAIRVEPDRRHATLPRIGRIKTHESARKLACRVEAGTVRVVAATITQDAAGRWHASFTVEVQRAAGKNARSAHAASSPPQANQSA